MKDAAELLPSDLAAAHAMILAERHARLKAEANAAVAEANAAVAKAEAANAQADLSSSEALIAHLKLAIEKLRRELHGTRSERTARLTSGEFCHPMRAALGLWYTSQIAKAVAMWYLPQ